MRYKKNSIFLGIILSTILVLGGCSTENNQIITENNAEEKLTENVELPQSMDQEINGVGFKLEKIEIPENLDLNNIKKSTANRQIPDIENTIKTVGEGKNSLEEYKDQFEGENGVKYDTYYVKYEDGSLISIDTTLVYSTPFFEKIHNSFRIENTSLYNAEQYTIRTHEFNTAEGCFDEIKTKICSCGYQPGNCNYEYYALDFDTMQQEELLMDKSGEENVLENDNWSSEDNCYYFFAEQIHDGIPVYTGEQDFPSDDLSNRPIQAVYSKDGLKRLDITKLYTFENLDESVTLKNFEDITNKVAEKYGNILTNAKYTVTRAKLYQMPEKAENGEYEVKVVWLFEIKESGTDSETGENYENTLYTCVDVETGEEVPI